MCGIFGQINSKYDNFDKKFFRMAGILNDARGGDSCGVMIDGEVEIGVDKLKLFSDFMVESRLVNDTKKSRVAIGHTRKASVGLINEVTAQPVCIYNDLGEIEYVLVHNGTIKNYKELATKYNVKCPDNYTDSMVVAEIMYRKGYDLLGEYIGAAAMVIVDYRKDAMNPEVLMFKGHSKQSQYGYGKAEDERPLYYARENGNLYFSSLTNVLRGCVNPTVYTLNENMLVRVSGDGKLTEVAKYDRVKAMEEYYATPTYSSYTSTGIVGIQRNTSFANRTLSEKQKTDKLVNCHTNPTRKIIFTADGYCYSDDKKELTICDGMFTVSDYGYAVVSSASYYSGEFYFINGLCIPSKTAYEAICNIRRKYCDEFLKEFPNMTLEDAKESFFDDYENAIALFSFMRLQPVKKLKDSVTVYNSDLFSGEIVATAYTGDFIPLFNPYTISYEIDNGDIVAKSELRGVCSTEFVKRELDAARGEYTAVDVYEVFYKILNTYII